MQYGLDRCRPRGAVAMVAGALWVFALFAGAQEAPAPASPPPTPATAPAGAPAEAPAPPAPAGAAATPAAADNGDVAVNLNNVDIDHVVKFLSEISGKPVTKHKDAKAQLSVFSPGKVTKERAFQLVTEALMLEKVAVVQNQDSIRLIPVEMLPDVTAEIIPMEGEQMTGGIVKAVISVRFTDVGEVEKVVKPLLSKNGSLVAHAPSKKLIVTDIASRVAAVKEIVAQLDVLDTEQRQIQVFELKHADPEELAPILKSVLTVLAAKTSGSPQGQQPQPGQPPPQPGQPGMPQGPSVLDVVPYKSANWLVVVAPKEIIAAAVPLVQEFDSEKPKELGLHVLPVKYADAQQVASDLSELFKKRPDKRVKETVEISADSRSSSLIILSSEENFSMIQTLVTEMDTEESVQMTTQSFELKFADASDIAEQMNDLYTGMQDQNSRPWYYFSSRSRDESKTRFVPEKRTNSVIAIAKPTDMPKITELIGKLDTPIDAEQVAPRIFHLKYVDAQEVTDVLNDVFGTGESSKKGGYYDYWYDSYSSDEEEEVGRLYGKVKFVTETTTNSIIVTTNNNENFKIISTFIESLDQVSPDAANTMVVKLQHAKAKDLADQLNSLFAAEGARMQPGQQGQGEDQEEQQSSFYSWMFGGQKKDEDKRSISNLIGQVRMVPDMRTNSLTLTTAVQNFPLLEKLIEELDIPTPKVLVRVRLIEVTTTDVLRVGTRFSSTPSIFETDDLDNGLRSTLGLEWADVYHNGTIKAGTDLDIGVLVQFLRRMADTRVLSEPTLVMNNNEEANIFVGSEIPFITNSQATPEGTLTQSFEYKKVGTDLKITPNINELNKVEMKVELKADQIRPGEVLFGGFITDSRQFNTQLAVESGDTIVIGGIIRESDSKATRGVPILEKVPVANLVFRKKDNKAETTELIAFITPTVLRDQAAEDEATKEAASSVKHISQWQPFEASVDPLAEKATDVTTPSEAGDSAEPVDPAPQPEKPAVEKKKKRPDFRRNKR